MATFQNIPTSVSHPHATGQGRWRFTVSVQAQKVFLVKQDSSGLSDWIEMKPGSGDEALGPKKWVADANLDPQKHNFNYYTVEGTTYFNCGSEGLDITPLKEAGNLQPMHSHLHSN